MKPKLLKMWAKFAYEVADLSTCDRTKVGCLLLSMDGERLLSYGYNGTYRGGPNAPLTDVPGNPYWVHAEANALVKTRPVEPFFALITHTPCVQCASLLVNSGAIAVLALGWYRLQEGWHLLREAFHCGQDRAESISPTLLRHGIPRGAYLLTGVNDEEA